MTLCVFKICTFFFDDNGVNSDSFPNLLLLNFHLKFSANFRSFFFCFAFKSICCLFFYFCSPLVRPLTFNMFQSSYRSRCPAFRLCGRFFFSSPFGLLFHSAHSKGMVNWLVVACMWHTKSQLEQSSVLDYYN